MERSNVLLKVIFSLGQCLWFLFKEIKLRNCVRLTAESTGPGLTCTWPDCLQRAQSSATLRLLRAARRARASLWSLVDI